METRVVISSWHFWTRGRVITILVILAALLLALVSLFRTVERPTTQVPVSMGSMGLHRLNIWLEPNPPMLGMTTITAQVVDQGGMPLAASSITFRVGRGEDEPGVEYLGVLMYYDGGNRAKFGLYRAVLNFPSPGDWWIDAVMQMASQQGTARIPVQVSQ